MKLTTGLTTLAIALSLTACGSKEGNNVAASAASATALAAIAPPAGTTWNDAVVKTAEGGFQMGNPNAPIKLIEYGALTCSHCADFAAHSHEKLNAMVAKGVLSFEFRNMMNNPLDIPAALLARCGGTAPFFQLTHQMFTAQKDWLGKAMALSQADQSQLAASPPAQIPALYASKTGLDTFVQQRGISTAQAQQCLGDTAAIDALIKIGADGQKQFQISGTPTFILNGVKVDNVASWDGLEPYLRAAGA